MKRSSKAHAKGRFAKNFYGSQSEPSSYGRMSVRPFCRGVCAAVSGMSGRVKRSSKAHAKGRFAKNFYGSQSEPSSHGRMSVRPFCRRLSKGAKGGLELEMKEIHIRPMEKRDVDAVSRLEEETFSMPWSREAFLEMITKKDAAYYVAESAEEIVGGCGVLMVAGEGNITNVAVKASARNQGIGTKLLRYMIGEGERNGLNAFTLEVRVSNAAAIHVYEKLGFRSEGIRPNFYEKPAEDAVIMWKR